MSLVQGQSASTYPSLAEKLAKTLAAAAQPSNCFDCPYYLQKNPDLPQDFDNLTCFQHFVNNGQFEGRPFRCALQNHVP
jgi:hypothetical protein